MDSREFNSFPSTKLLRVSVRVYDSAEKSPAPLNDDASLSLVCAGDVGRFPCS